MFGKGIMHLNSLWGKLKGSIQEEHAEDDCLWNGFG